MRFLATDLWLTVILWVTVIQSSFIALLPSRQVAAQQPYGASVQPAVPNYAPIYGTETGVYQPNPWLPPNGRDPSRYINVELGVIGLIRESPESQTLAIDQTFAEVLNADALQGSMQFGLRALVDVYNFSPLFGGTDLQFGYFGINSLDAEQTIAGTAISPIFFNALPVTPFTSVDFNYSSNIYSGEANLRFRTWQKLRPIAGLRYFKLEDTYDVFNTVSGGRTGGFSLTNNSMIGGQFGCEGIFYRGRNLELYANGKFGLMHNRVEGSTEAADATGISTVKNYNDSNFTTFCDIDTGVNIFLTESFMLKIGYQFLFADKVALGIDQNDSVFILSPGETVSFNSQQWHGVNFSTQYRF